MADGVRKRWRGLVHGPRQLDRPLHSCGPSPDLSNLVLIDDQIAQSHSLVWIELHHEILVGDDLPPCCRKSPTGQESVFLRKCNSSAQPVALSGSSQ
jgi:hypothetical protein